MLEPLTPGIWAARGPFSVAGLKLGCRATIVKLSDGRLWIHSPIEFSPEDVEEIRNLGEVAFLVAPSPQRTFA